MVGFVVKGVSVFKFKVELDLANALHRIFRFRALVVVNLIIVIFFYSILLVLSLKKNFFKFLFRRKEEGRKFLKIIENSEKIEEIALYK